MIVDEAISSIRRIEHASCRVAQIIDVIDDVAFQTNLLALNAGIAGESGQGFAVVAHDVPKFAQRAADAVTEIKR